MRTPTYQGGGGVMGNIPAFPRPFSEETPIGSNERYYAQDGMSLRDYFAGQALPAIMTRDREHRFYGTDYAIEAYNVADAMLANRDELITRGNDFAANSGDATLLASQLVKRHGSVYSAIEEYVRYYSSNKAALTPVEKSWRLRVLRALLDLDTQNAEAA